MSKTSRPTFGSLFAGIGGFDLGLERAGWKPAWQVEIDPFCRKVLQRHWPEVPKFEDVREVGRHNLAPVDLICGGFPCPVVSRAAHGRNAGEWLWPEFARIIRLLQPKFALVENVNGLRERRLGEVLGDLAEIGYDAEWNVLPASLFGAPHKRARVWVVAYSDSYSKSNGSVYDETSFLSELEVPFKRWVDPVTYIRVDDGFSQRLACEKYGNAVVPQIVEWIGRRLLEYV